MKIVGFCIFDNVWMIHVKSLFLDFFQSLWKHRGRHWQPSQRCFFYNNQWKWGGDAMVEVALVEVVLVGTLLKVELALVAEWGLPLFSKAMKRGSHFQDHEILCKRLLRTKSYHESKWTICASDPMVDEKHFQICPKIKTLVTFQTLVTFEKNLAKSRNKAIGKGGGLHCYCSPQQLNNSRQGSQKGLKITISVSRPS